MLIKCVGDIARVGASLRVTCLNCSREAHIKARFLIARYGYSWQLERLQDRFRCSRCHGTNVRFGLALPELAEKKIGEMTWFGGLYKKLED